MNRQSWKIRRTGFLVAITALTTLAAVPALGQVPVDDQGNPLGNAATDASGYNGTEQPVGLSASELDELVGPVALYPDDLLAIVLPASTYPLEIVQAARFLEEYEQDSTLQPNEDWDESVTALLNYPEVLRMMNDDIDWTWQLGDAVVNQQADVIAAVETFRDRAYAAGNLKSDQHQTVSEDEGIIEIVPVNEEIIYVPYYEPEQVVVRQVTPVYYYYPRPYPVYYYPYPVGFSFYSGHFWGVTTAYRIGWATDHLHVHHHSYWGHPYFGHSYYGHYYRSPSVYLYNSWYVNDSVYYSSHGYGNRYRDGDYWRPRTHSRARPAYYSSRTRSYRNDDVSRGSAARAYGNADTSRISTPPSANRTVRPVTSGDRVRTEQSSTRDVRSDSRSDSIRFRERNENRQSIRRDPATSATRSDTAARSTARTDSPAYSRAESRNTSRTESRTTTRTVPRRLPVTTTTTTGNNGTRTSTRETTRETVVRRPVSGQSEVAVVRQSSRGTESRVPRETNNSSQTVQRDRHREASPVEARTEARNSTPERREARTDSLGEARGEPRQAQASVRQGNPSRREKN